MANEEPKKKEEWKPEELEEKKDGFEQDYIRSSRGYSPFEIGRRLKFGEGDNTIKIDVLQGFWAGNQVYAQAPFRLSAAGTIEKIILLNYANLPATCSQGELARSGGSLYICQTTNNWVVVGRQN